MAKINTNTLTQEQIEKAMGCETAEELMELAKAEGIELTKDEAEAYMAEMEDVELDEEMLSKAAGGFGYNVGDGTPHCFAGDSEVAVPGGARRIADMQVGDKVITLDADGKEIVGTVTEVVPPVEAEIVEAAFSNGALWRTTESQTLYLGHKRNCMVRDAAGKAALLRDGGNVTVTDVRFTGTREKVYDIFVGGEDDENVFFVAGIAAEGYFTKKERGLS